MEGRLLLQPHLLNRNLPHLELLDLPGNRHRELIHELVVPGDLEVGDLALAEGLQVLSGDRCCIRCQLHPGDQLFAVFVIGDAGYLHFFDGRVGVEELFDFFRVDVLTAADHHVLDAANDLDVALFVHGGQVAGMHPAGIVDGFAGFLFVVPVLQHHAVATGAEFADLAAGNDVAGARVDNLGFQVRLGAAHGGYLLLERVEGAGLGRNRAGFGHAVGNLNFFHVHLAVDLLHYLGRADGASHDAGAQAGEIVGFELRLGQFGDEHGGHAVQGRGLFLVHGLQHRLGLEAFARVDHGRTVGDAAQVAHDHTKAVIQGNRDHQAVFLGQELALAHEVSVVEDVVVGEGSAFRVTGGAGGELDVDGVIELQFALALLQIGLGRIAGEADEFLPGPHAIVFVFMHVDHGTQLRHVVGLELAGGAALELRGQLVDHFAVVGGFEAVRGYQGGDAGQVERVLQFVHTVSRVDVHQDGADFGGGELGDCPLVAVRGPDAHAVTAFDADGHEGPGGFVDFFNKFFVGPANVLVQAHQGLVVRVLLGGAVEHFADGHAQQGLFRGSAGITW